MLDITGNPLVALYFTCAYQQDLDGELVLITTNKSAIKYPVSDTVSIQASLAALTYDRKEKLKNIAQDDIDIEDPDIYEEYRDIIDPFLQEIRLEKPAFTARLKMDDITGSCVVQAAKGNMRIIRQDGAFILCGLISDGSNALEKYRMKKGKKTAIVIIKHENKKHIEEQLEKLSINYATLFPEIECVAKFLADSYSETKSVRRKLIRVAAPMHKDNE